MGAECMRPGQGHPGAASSVSSSPVSPDPRTPARVDRQIREDRPRWGPRRARSSTPSPSGSVMELLVRRLLIGPIAFLAAALGRGTGRRGTRFLFAPADPTPAGGRSRVGTGAAGVLVDLRPAGSTSALSMPRRLDGPGGRPPRVLERPAVRPGRSGRSSPTACSARPGSRAWRSWPPFTAGLQGRVTSIAGLGHRHLDGPAKASPSALYGSSTRSSRPGSSTWPKCRRERPGRLDLTVTSP